MYQNLIQQYPDQKINLMRKHYHDKYCSMISFRSDSLIYDIAQTLNQRLPSSWITNLDPAGVPLTKQITVSNQTFLVQPYFELYQKLDENADSLNWRYDGYNFKVYFEKYELMTEIFDWAIQQNTQYGLNWRLRAGATDQAASSNQVTMRNAAFKDFKYKVILRDPVSFSLGSDLRGRLAEVLKQFGDQVKISGSFRQFLDQSRPIYWFSSLYFFAKNAEIITYLSLAFPNLIGKTYEVNYLPSEKNHEQRKILNRL